MCRPDISVIERFMNDFEIPPGQTNLTHHQKQMNTTMSIKENYI